MRWSLASAAAASIAMAVILVTTYTRSTSAADFLMQSVQASSQFKGWVHIRESVQGEKDFFIQHINNETGAWASENHIRGGLDVQMYLPAEKQEIKYSSGDGEIKIGEISQQFANGWKTLMQDYPLSEDALLTRMKTQGATARQSMEGGLVRFDLTFPADDPQKAMEQHRSAYPSGAVVWVDPASKLIEKGQFTTEGEARTMECSYGDPAVRDVYDLGVPKDAKVVDVRPPRDLSALMQRLQKRFDDGFGDFVAVRTATYHSSDNGKQSPPGQQVEIYGASGAAYTAENFEISADFDLGSRADPAERLKMVLDRLKRLTPNSFLVSDGKDTWQGYNGTNAGMHSTKIQGQAVQTLPDLKMMFTLPGQLWPVRDLSTVGADTRSQIITDPARPGQIGVKIDRPYFMHAPDDTKLAQVYWFDPARDDLPVERAEIYTSAETKKVVQEVRLATLAFSQTQNGKWYPTQWTQKMAVYSLQRSVEYSSDNHLQIWTGEKLGSEWFADPAIKAAAKTTSTTQETTKVPSPSTR